MSARPSKFTGTPARPVLVGACARSGTTLLRAMLDSHPELGMPRETRFVIESWDRRRVFGDLDKEENRRALATWIFDRKETWRGRLGLDHADAVERLVAAPPTLGSMLATIFEMYAQVQHKPRWGDKRPMYANRLEVVFGLFPNAQFVNVVRDPRACAASMRKLDWYEGRVVPAVDLWLRSVEGVDAWRGRLGPDQLLDVRYEDLVSDPTGTLGGIAAFAGIAGDGAAMEAMLRYHERPEERSERYHANVSRPPDPSRATGWTDVLEPGEVAFVEEATGPLLARHGYEPHADGVAAPAELRRELQALRRRRLAQRITRSPKESVRRLFLDRRPLAAAPASQHGERRIPGND